MKTGQIQVLRSLMTSRVGVALIAVIGLAAFYMYVRQAAVLRDMAQREQETLSHERDRLEELVRERSASLSELANYLQEIREEERAHLARELHDELGALLTAAKLDVSRLKAQILPNSDEVRTRLDHLVQSLDSGIALKRRIIEDLRPSTLSNLGLEAALKFLMIEYAGRAAMEVECSLEKAVDLPNYTHLTVYRRVQEALTNIAKDAEATRIFVSMHTQPRREGSRVRDNGKGFDTEAVRLSSHRLLGMRHRVQAAGAGWSFHLMWDAVAWSLRRFPSRRILLVHCLKPRNCSRDLRGVQRQLSYRPQGSWPTWLPGCNADSGRMHPNTASRPFDTPAEEKLPEPLPPYGQPAGGWGSLKAVAVSVVREGATLRTANALRQQNKPGGFACVSCAWAKPGKPHLAEFCENGAKATAWELTEKRADSAFFAQHAVTDLRGWSDHEIEATGRLVEPMRYDEASDRYVPTAWDEAFAAIGAALQGLRDKDPQATVFYASGRASLETSYMYQLLARLYGNNNLPDSSNMCHESTSVALPETIGVPVGTVRLDDFEQTDAIFFFGQNVGVNSPRMLHQLQKARQRGVPIVTFNPMKEVGLVHFANPQSPREMLSTAETVISTQYLQVRNGGDIAALTGMCKWLVEADDAVQGMGGVRVLDADFIASHTEGFGAFADAMRAASWSDIERESGLARAALEQAAKTYAAARAVIGIYGMGLTQHREGVANVQMVSNLLLLRGNIGKRGAGICPVRGHSNVQGQRTVGITEKPELAPLDQLAALYQFEPPRTKGLDTVGTCQGVIDGSVHAFIGLGGNFLRAAPDTARLEAAWSRLQLTVHIATRPNHTHMLPGQQGWLLPCLGRIEVDEQASGPQTVAVEDSTGCFHASHGVAEPAARTLRSEAAIVAGIARATLTSNQHVPWDRWVDDYAVVRDAIEATWPAVFEGFNKRIHAPAGMPRPNPARERVWKTPSGKARFVVPPAMDSEYAAMGPDVLRLMTVRSDDQFNTTVYSLDDRFRNVWGTRMVLLMHPEDMVARGIAQGDELLATTTGQTDGHNRQLAGLRALAYDLPRGSVAGYFPECNPLVPLAHHAKKSHVPAGKCVPIRVARLAHNSLAFTTPSP